MLSQEHKKEFAEAAEDKYDIKVKPSQIISLSPSKFKCETQFYDDQDEMHELSGE
jgi:hypothetical protein